MRARARGSDVFGEIAAARRWRTVLSRRAKKCEEEAVGAFSLHLNFSSCGFLRFAEGDENDARDIIKGKGREMRNLRVWRI